MNKRKARTTLDTSKNHHPCHPSKQSKKNDDLIPFLP